MMKIATLSVALVACSPATWRDRDTVLEAAFIAATVIDYGQSLAIVERCAEANPVIGECGENAGLTPYMLLVLISHLAISTSLDPEWRTTWQGITFGVEAHQAYTNQLHGWGYPLPEL
jgi:hypothetical protein